MLTQIALPPENGEKISRAVIILHGLGDCAKGIMGLGHAWQNVMPETLFLAPDAPFPCIYVPGGHQWFDAEDWSSDVVLKGVEKASPYLIEYIEKSMERYNLSPDRIALVGFSQGAMMGLYVGPRLNKQVAGILSYSGALVGGETLAKEKKADPPVLLVHGTKDEVVPFLHMTDTESGLRHAGFNVRSLACIGVDHAIDDLGLREGAIFLRRVLGVES